MAAGPGRWARLYRGWTSSRPTPRPGYLYPLATRRSAEPGERSPDYELRGAPVPGLALTLDEVARAGAASIRYATTSNADTSVVFRNALLPSNRVVANRLSGEADSRIAGALLVCGRTTTGSLAKAAEGGGYLDTWFAQENDCSAWIQIRSPILRKCVLANSRLKATRDVSSRTQPGKKGPSTTSPRAR